MGTHIARKDIPLATPYSDDPCSCALCADAGATLWYEAEPVCLDCYSRRLETLLETAVAGLDKIRCDYGPNHVSAFCRDVATDTLTALGAVIPEPVSSGNGDDPYRFGIVDGGSTSHTEAGE